MRFENKMIDVSLELILINGETVTLTPKHVLSASFVKKVLKKWTKRDEVNGEKIKNKEDFETIHEIMARDLNDVYDVPGNKIDWWLENFTIETLKEVFDYVGNSLAGRKSANG